MKRWKGASKDLMIIDHRHTIHTTPQSKPKSWNQLRMGMPAMGMPMIPGMALQQGKPAESTPKAAAA